MTNVVIKRLNNEVLVNSTSRESAINELLNLYGFEVEETTEAIVTFEGEEMLASRKAEIEAGRAEQVRVNRIAEIKKQLEAIDKKSIRAIRENDTEYISQYTNQAQELRTELATLQTTESEDE